MLMAFGLALASAFLLSGANASVLELVMYPTFVLVGGGWATINVHSYIMSVEMADEKTTGTYTGLYYAFSMTAQIVTPYLAGLVIEYISMRALIPYSLVFMGLAFLSMLPVRHGNAIKTEERGKDEEVEQN